MKQNYFVVDGKKYYTGTVFVIKDCNGRQTEAYFICYDTDLRKYIYKTEGCRWSSHDNFFWNRFVAVTDKVNNEISYPVAKVQKDLEIDGLFIGWVWYIFLMLISTIFKDAIGLWGLITVVFFSWRSKKIKEEGTYIEW